MAVSNDIDMGYVLRLEPKMAVDYLKSKGLNITWDWHEQLENAHARAFTVAKVTKADVLATLQEYTTTAVQKGWSHQRYIDELEPLLRAKGWWGKQKIIDENDKETEVQFGSPHRLKLILDTNKSVAYHVARYASQIANMDEQPYWMYVAIRDSRTRKSHLLMDRKVYRATDPIWEYIYPPNDWRCRCYVRALSDFQLTLECEKVLDSKDSYTQEIVDLGVDKRTGEMRQGQITRLHLPNGQEFRTGAGWNHNVGKAALGQDMEAIRKLKQLQNRELRQQSIQALNNSPARHKAFENWVFGNLGKMGASSRYISAGFVTTEIAEKVPMLSNGEKYSELVLVMSERNLQHANSKKHHNTGIGLTPEEYASISRIIANPSLVLWDKRRGHNNLMYFNADRTIQVIVENQINTNRLKPKEKVDAIINAFKIEDFSEILKEIEGGNIEIIQGNVK